MNTKKLLLKTALLTAITMITLSCSDQKDQSTDTIEKDSVQQDSTNNSNEIQVFGPSRY